MKIVICDDHKIVRDGLRLILQRLEEISLIEEAGSGNEVFELLSNNIFDVVLLDISLPDINGLEVLKSIKEKWPLVNVLVLSMLPQEQYAIRALKLKASGYLNKDISSDELRLAVRKVSKGGKYISYSLAETLAINLAKDDYNQKHDMLSTREFEIMIRLANGMSLQEIGNELCISVKTVSTYRSRVMEKMELNRNTDLARYCLEFNLI